MCVSVYIYMCVVCLFNLIYTEWKIIKRKMGKIGENEKSIIKGYVVNDPNLPHLNVSELLHSLFFMASIKYMHLPPPPNIFSH